MTVHVLFVDDEQPNLAVFTALCGESFNVLTASSAAEALEVMRHHEVGVVLSDQRMPGTTGVVLLEQIRAEFPDTVRMLVTAYADLGATIEAINRGHVRRYVRKPWDAEELKAHLAEAVALYQTQRETHALERRLLETERVYGLGVIASSLAAEMRGPAATVSERIQAARDLLRVGLDSTRPQENESRSLRARMAQADEALVDAVGAVDAMMSLVRGIELPTQAREGTSVDLRNVVRLTLRILGAELRDVGEVKIELGSVPDVRGSSVTLGQVVINLLVNAIRAVAEKPRRERFISVRLCPDGGTVRLEVEDNRSEPVSGRTDVAFDPLAKRERVGGTALGLAISKRIAEEVGGRIDVETTQNRHTSFRFVVPVAQPH
jgi:signal transduction histidine kinase